MLAYILCRSHNICMHETLRPPQALVSFDVLSQVEVVIEREGGIIEAYVPIDIINQEDVAVDQSHVVELAESIKQESQKNQTTGQLTPVLLGHLPGEDKLRIIDGFHRVPAVKMTGNSQVYATVKTDCTFEDITDLRIVAAKSHKKVKFSRIVEWVEEAWATTPWADRVEVGSAFVLALLNNSGGRTGSNGNRLSPNEIVAVKEWVHRKCGQWDVSVNYVDRYLRTARTADPELVRVARERTSGHKLEEVTPKHLEQIARHLPNEYMLQNIVARAAVNNTLTVPQTQALSLAVAKAPTYEAMDSAIDSRIWERMASASKSLTRKRYKEIDPSSPESYVATLVDKFFDEQIAVVEVLIENAILKGVYSSRDKEVGKRINDLLITSDTVELDFEELPDGQQIVWSTEKITSAAEEVDKLRPSLKKIIARQYHFSDQDIEDILSVATMRFLDRVNDGRLPEEYSNGDRLTRLMARFVNFAAIDEVRRIRGRQGQKPFTVSIHQEVEEGLPLENTLVAPEEETLDEDQYKDDEFIKNLLPFLNERQRRVLIMKAYFELTYEDIAKILGTTTATIAQTFVSLKKKAITLSENAQAEVTGLTG